ncbi:MAG: hypothetical protein M1839_001659 [Geoglossum umbratile]|nr:MAG: hypothetical protein M1839_001659 [Geoglossum umbratile]
MERVGGDFRKGWGGAPGILGDPRMGGRGRKRWRRRTGGDGRGRDEERGGDEEQVETEEVETKKEVETWKVETEKEVETKKAVETKKKEVVMWWKKPWRGTIPCQLCQKRVGGEGDRGSLSGGDGWNEGVQTNAECGGMVSRRMQQMNDEEGEEGGGLKERGRVKKKERRPERKRSGGVRKNERRPGRIMTRTERRNEGQQSPDQNKELAGAGWGGCHKAGLKS